MSHHLRRCPLTDSPTMTAIHTVSSGVEGGGGCACKDGTQAKIVQRSAELDNRTESWDAKVDAGTSNKGNRVVK